MMCWQDPESLTTQPMHQVEMIQNVLVAQACSPFPRGLQAPIEKENNFSQAGARFRSWPHDRQERFINRFVGILADPRTTPEVCSVWLSYWSQVGHREGGIG